MKRSDYKNHLDKIKCSPEFRIRMEERLSAERDGEYADSVSDVERVTKINYHRWTALAASAVLVLGIGGAAFCFAKNSDPTSENMLSDTGDDDKIPFALEKRSAETYSMNVTMFNYDSVGRTENLNIGNIPEEAADKIIDGLEKCQWDIVESDKFYDVSSETRININCTGAEEFVYTIDTNGYAMLEREGEQTFYYNENSYFNIVSTIAYYLPYCDWNSMVGGEKGEKLDVIFKEHIDEIRPTRTNVYQSNSLMLMWNDPYTVYIDQYGTITVFYDTQYDSGYGGNGSNTVYFSSSPEMYEQIIKELGDRLEKETATEAETALPTEILSPTESVYKIIDENITADPMDIFYKSGSGQFNSHSFTVSNVDMNNIVKIIKSLEWEVSENQYPQKDFYVVRNLIITLSGEIYDQQSSKMYSPANGDFSDLTVALSDLLSYDDFTYVMSLLANSGKKSAMSCSDFTFYYSDAAVSPSSESEIQYIKRGGTGIFYHDNSYNEYYMIIDSDSYTGEYYETNRNWTMIESGDKITEYEEIDINSDDSQKKISSGFSGMDYCLMDYDTICTYAIHLIDDIYTSSESTSSVDCRYDENTGCFTFSLKGSLYESNVISININIADGNVVKAYIERIDLNTNKNVLFYDFQLGDGMGGGINYYTENLDIYSQISDDMKFEKSQTED